MAFRNTRNSKTSKKPAATNSEYTKVGKIWMYEGGDRYRYFGSILIGERDEGQRSYAAFLDKSKKPPKNGHTPVALVGAVYEKDEDGEIDFDEPVGSMFLFRNKSGKGSHFFYGSLVFQEDGEDTQRIRVSIWKTDEDEGKSYKFNGLLQTKDGDDEEDEPTPKKKSTRRKPAPVEDEDDEELDEDDESDDSDEDDEDLDDEDDDSDSDDESLEDSDTDDEDDEDDDEPSPKKRGGKSGTVARSSAKTTKVGSTSATTKGRRGTSSRSSSKPKGSNLARAKKFDY